MIRTRTGALAIAAVLLSACQSAYYQPSYQPAPRATAMDGMWRSDDGVFVATFRDGSFTSRFTSTNEVLAQGTYTVTGGNVSMQWVSVQAQQKRSASCSFTGTATVSCNQAGGGRFGLSRAA